MPVMLGNGKGEQGVQFSACSSMCALVSWRALFLDCRKPEFGRSQSCGSDSAGAGSSKVSGAEIRRLIGHYQRSAELRHTSLMSSHKAARLSPRLPLFALAETPYNIPTAVATLIPMYMLRRQGMSIEQSSTMAAFCGLPATFYFLYAPLADFFLRRKTWYLLALGMTSLLLVMALLKASIDHVHLLTALLFAAMFTVMIISASTGGLMSSLLNRSEKARVGAWVGLGSQAGSTLGFGLLTWLVPHVSRPVLALASLLFMLPGLVVLLFQEPALPKCSQTPGQVIRTSLLDVKQNLLQTRNVPALLLLLLPVSSTAVTTVLSGLTSSYSASAAQLAFANGLGGGLSAAAGALCILLVPVRWNRMVPYALSSLLYGTVSFAIAAGPLRPATFVIGMLLSNFASGFAFGAFPGVLLQIVNSAGRVQGTSYSALNSIANLPILYMTWLEGQAAGHFGPRSIGVLDGTTNFLVGGGFFVWWALSGHRNTEHQSADPSAFEGRA